MTFDNALKVATTVAATEMASGSKRKRSSKGKESAEAGHANKKSKKGFKIDKKSELLLTYADTRGVTTRSDVALMLENKQKNIEFIVSKEKNHNGEIALDHIHAYLNFIDAPLTTRDIRYFDVEYPPEANQPFPTNHPNIRYKNEFNKNPIQASIDMIEYVTKEDKDPICNFDWQQRLKELKDKLKNKGGKGKDVLEIPFYDWVNEDPRPDGEEVKRRIRTNKIWYDQYCLKFLNFNSLIKAEFDCRRGNEKPKAVYDRTFIIPLKLRNWIKSFEEWRLKKYDRPRGLVLTGPPKSGKTSLLACIGVFSYFPNIWDMKNWEQNAEFNWFEDQDVVFECIEDFRWFKGFIGSQQVLTMTDKYCVKKTVRNDRPCVWTNNNKLTKQVKDDDVLQYFKDNMEIVELGEWDLIGKYPKSTISGTQWVEWDPKGTWYYQNVIKPATTDEASTSNSVTTSLEVNVDEPPSEWTPPPTPNFMIRKSSLDENSFIIDLTSEEENDEPSEKEDVADGSSL